MRQRIVYKAIEKFETTIKVRELVAQIEAEIQQMMGQISESGMEKLAVKLGEAKLELAQLRLKLVPWYDGLDKNAVRKELKDAERELANLNLYLRFLNKPGNKQPREELAAFRKAVWSDLMCELVDNRNAAFEEQCREEERDEMEEERESESANAT